MTYNQLHGVYKIPQIQIKEKAYTVHHSLASNVWSPPVLSPGYEWMGKLPGHNSIPSWWIILLETEVTRLLLLLTISWNKLLSRQYCFPVLKLFPRFHNVFIKTVLTLNEKYKNSQNNDKMKIYNLIVILHGTITCHH